MRWILKATIASLLALTMVQAQQEATVAQEGQQWTAQQKTESQDDGIPESCLGIHVEGPSSEGFCFYPVYRTKGRQGRASSAREFNHIYPDGKNHNWSFDYDPLGASGKGQITVVFDRNSHTFDLEEGDRSAGTTFDRFGIVTSWIDGNSQDVYWDDITYTVTQ